MHARVHFTLVAGRTACGVPGIQTALLGWLVRLGPLPHLNVVAGVTVQSGVKQMGKRQRIFQG